MKKTLYTAMPVKELKQPAMISGQHRTPSGEPDLMERAAKAAQEARIEELEEHIADLIEASGQECACGYDNPGDVCLQHTPHYLRQKKQIDALKARNKELEALIPEEETE